MGEFLPGNPTDSRRLRAGEDENSFSRAARRFARERQFFDKRICSSDSPCGWLRNRCRRTRLAENNGKRHLGYSSSYRRNDEISSFYRSCKKINKNKTNKKTAYLIRFIWYTRVQRTTWLIGLPIRRGIFAREKSARRFTSARTVE